MNNIVLNKTLLLILIAFGIIASYVLLSKAILLFLPFVIAYIISKLLKGPVELLVDKLYIHRGVSALICLVSFITISGTLLFTLVQFIVAKLVYVSVLVPDIIKELMAYNDLVDMKLEKFRVPLSFDIGALFNRTITSLLSDFGIFMADSAKGILLGITHLPSLIIFVMVVMISSFFFIKDADLIHDQTRAFFKRHHMYPKQFRFFKKNVIFVILGYLKAQAILMCITFILSFIGLTFIGIKHAPLIALGIALIDALPIFGPATVYVPWVLSMAIVGDFATAISLLALYLVVTLTRQMCEPKVVGQQIGIYPLITLLSMYTGLKTLGILGLILGPLTVITIKTMYQLHTDENNQ